MKTFEKQARQGDVFLKRVDAMPKGVEKMKREGGRVVLAHGEVTGHMHAIAEKHVQQFRAPVGKNEAGDFKLRAGGSMAVTFIKVDKPCLLTHDEHEAIQIQPGVYEVRRQREYQRGEIRQVAD
jgi:hypothetical protein